jgi:transcriptional regulator with XRE-family HTH domain
MNQAALGSRLRSLRLGMGLSLAQVQSQTGISSSFLSLVEQGRSDISIGRLLRLARFFDVEIADLVLSAEAGDDPTVAVTRVAERRSLRSPSEGIDLYVLGGSSRRLTPLLCIHEPGGATTVDAEPDVETFLFVVRGAFTLELDGGEPVHLHAGDAATHRGGHRLTVRNPGPGAAEMLAVTEKQRPAAAQEGALTG